MRVRIAGQEWTREDHTNTYRLPVPNAYVYMRPLHDLVTTFKKQNKQTQKSKKKKTREEKTEVTEIHKQSWPCNTQGNPPSECIPLSWPKGQSKHWTFTNPLLKRIGYITENP